MMTTQLLLTRTGCAASLRAQAIKVRTINSYQLEAAAGFRKTYIHLDLDVLDPTDFLDVVCLTPGGIRIGYLEQLLSELLNIFESIVASVLEFMPDKLSADRTLVAASLTEIVQL